PWRAVVSSCRRLRTRGCGPPSGGGQWPAAFRGAPPRPCRGRLMKPIPVGAKGSFTLLVQPEHLANRFKDAMLPAVFATPVMIMVMENAALNAIKAYLDPG